MQRHRRAWQGEKKGLESEVQLLKSEKSELEKNLEAALTHNERLAVEQSMLQAQMGELAEERESAKWMIKHVKTLRVFLLPTLFSHIILPFNPPRIHPLAR